MIAVRCGGDAAGSRGQGVYDPADLLAHYADSPARRNRARTGRAETIMFPMTASFIIALGSSGNEFNSRNDFSGCSFSSL